MAINHVQTVDGETYLIQVANTVANTTTYAHIGMINTDRSISFTASTDSVEVTDLDNPSAPAPTATNVTGYSVKVDGQGLVDARLQSQIIDWFLSGASKECKLVQTNSGANGGFTLAGKFVITQNQLQGGARKFATGSLTLESDGPVLRTTNT